MNATPNPNTVIAIVIAVLVVAVLVWTFTRQKRSAQLRQRFGPEYDRTLHESKSARRAEAELEKRARRVDHLDIRPLPPDQRVRYQERWKAQQARFVDEPKAAIVEADHLVAEVMELRGYPVTNFEQRAADVSVDHPRVVDNYRAAHAIAERDERGQATTEDLRQAMVYYRSLFEDLLFDRSLRTEVHA
jgi:hypothetical protein